MIANCGEPTLNASILNGGRIRLSLQSPLGGGEFVETYINGLLNENIELDDFYFKNVREISPILKKPETMTPLEKLLIVFCQKFCRNLVNTVAVMHTVEFTLSWQVEGSRKEYTFSFQRPESPQKDQFALLYVGEMLQYVVSVIRGEKLELNGCMKLNVECRFSYQEVKHEPMEEPKPSRWEWFLKAFCGFKLTS